MLEDLPPSAPLRGAVAFADVILPCLIHASSTQGASLSIEARDDIPRDFTLIDVLRRRRRPARIAWRRGPHIRVQFIDAPEPPPLKSMASL